MSEQCVSKTISGDGATSVVGLSGSLSIENCGDLRRILAESLGESQRIILDMSKLESLDMTTIQVICSACKSAAAQQRVFITETSIPACVVDLGRGIGAPQGVPCSQNSNDPCIWFGGGA